MAALITLWTGKRTELIRQHDFRINECRHTFEEPSKAYKRAETQADEIYDSLSSVGVNPEDAHFEAMAAGLEMHEDVENNERLNRLGALSLAINEFEKAFRALMENELSQSYERTEIEAFCRHRPLKDLYRILEHSGWDLRSRPWFPMIECGCVVNNVLKHGPGHSLDRLAREFPHHLREYWLVKGGKSDPVREALFATPVEKDLDINVTEFDAIAAAIRSFWQEFPNRLKYEP